jgi:hypothetical protein
MPRLAQKRIPIASRIDFPQKTTSSAPRDGKQLLEEVIFTTEKNFAKRLGNSERVQKWQKEKSFKTPRREWLGAWKRFAEKHHLGSLPGIHAGVQQTLEPVKNFTLALFRFCEPQAVLRNQAGVIYAAAREGDVKFFRAIHLAFKSREFRSEADTSFLAYNILCYWFAGLLWLMNDEAGRAALCAYTGHSDITQDAYRKSRERLGLNGHRDRVEASPILWYEPEKRLYKYGPGWTDLEPHLSI